MPLTLDQMNVAIQQMTMAAIYGVTIDPNDPADPNLSKLQHIRLDWPTAGQPDWAITEDVAFIGCTEEDDEYDRLRDTEDADVIPPPNPDGSAGAITQVQHTVCSTRVWRVAWTLYGPKSFERARALRSSLLSDYICNQLAGSNLYTVPNLPPPVRAPEQFQGQWWERVDFHALMNEAVQETTVINAVAFVEVQSSTAAAKFADQTISD